MGCPLQTDQPSGYHWMKAIKNFARFLTYFVWALQSTDASLGTRVAAALQSPQNLPVETILTLIINDLAESPQHLLFMLDDYHLCDTKPINDAISFLLDHLPPTTHLAIASREEPQIPLARLRARGELTELRAADLRFTLGETDGFLNNAMDLHLSPDDIAALETRTEGWITGLQLAAISIQGHENASTFIQSFTGSHRFVLDYLVEEVLKQQQENIQSFLLQTSILDRLCGSLCDAILNHQDGSVNTLEFLERTNLMIIPLDDKRQWYRYHHLFTDVLRARLMKAQPQIVAELHRRASDWYEQHDLWSDAIQHAFAAEDFANAARLIELAWPMLRRTRQEATVLGWIKMLPEHFIHVSPCLNVSYAWGLLNDGDYAAAEASLQDAERWLYKAEDAEAAWGEIVVADHQQFASLPATIANARAYHAQAIGDVAATILYTEQALTLLPQEDYYERGTTTALLGLAYWASGNLDAAYRSFANGLESLRSGGGILIMIGGAAILSEILKSQAKLHAAKRLFEDTLQLAMPPNKPPLHGTAELYLGLSAICCEQGDLAIAKEYYQKGAALREQASLPGYEYVWSMTEARLKEIDGDLDSAYKLLNEAEQLYYRSPIPNIRPVTAVKARMWAAHGSLHMAEAWVREYNLTVDDNLSYVQMYAHITLARILIARYRSTREVNDIDDITKLLQRLRHTAEAGNWTASIIEILMLQSLVEQLRNNIDIALSKLERALALAEPESYVRLFVDEGSAMATLLRQVQIDSSPFLHRLLTALDDDQPQTRANPPQSNLIEPLSERENEVLEHIAEGLTNQEIADRLFLSLHTVKVHARNINAKLGTSNRTQAVARGRDLGILTND